MTNKEWKKINSSMSILGIEYKEALSHCDSLLEYLTIMKSGFYAQHQPTELCSVSLNEYTLDYIIQAIKEWIEQWKYIFGLLKTRSIEGEREAADFHERVIKDLEILEILKKYLTIKNTTWSRIITCDIDALRDEEYTTIEEWLENDK